MTIYNTYTIFGTEKKLKTEYNKLYVLSLANNTCSDCSELHNILDAVFMGDDYCHITYIEMEDAVEKCDICPGDSAYAGALSLLNYPERQLRSLRNIKNTTWN